ncbi:hypothetical protein ACJ41O_014285 [Fusarium nematophilum]
MDSAATISHPSKQYVQTLQNRVRFLEAFIDKVAAPDEATRRLLLADKTNWSSTHVHNELNAEPAQVNTPSLSTSPSDQGTLVLAKARECRMRNHNARKATQFYGGTSLLQMSTSTTTPPAEPGLQQANIDISTAETQPLDPRGKTCRHLMAVFFQNVYQYNMCIYREWFLRDYAAGEGPYYSDALMYAICAVGALVSPDTTHEPLSAILAAHAQGLVLKSLDMPDLTILQALVVLGYLEVGQGRSSRGWLYCGMAFRLTHEMGLHLDPCTWNRSSSDSSVDREILRRVYWAVFVADKHLSLYFGRPPALYPHEADVRNTIRIPYPPEESLLDKYISKGSSATAFEDGISFIGAFIHQVELAKILHTMIVDVFENRRRQSTDAAAAAESAQRVHDSLVRWHSMLPQKLHWSQWTVGKVPPYVLHLHMLFHTAMIILHRPPRKHLEDEAVIKSEGIEVCYESLSATLRLLKSYGRYYRFEVLPLDFVHTLSAAAEVVMMRKYMQRSSWDDNDVSRPMALILETMASVQRVFPCVREIRDSITQIMEADRQDNGQRDEENVLELDLMDLLQSGAAPFPGASWCPEETGSVNSSDLGLLVTDDFLNEPSSWGGAYAS